MRHILITATGKAKERKERRLRLFARQLNSHTEEREIAPQAFQGIAAMGAPASSDNLLSCGVTADRLLEIQC